MFHHSQFPHSPKNRRFLFVFLIPLIFLALSAAVMLLWNAILPDVIHAGRLNYWQALGLLALCRLLFGGFGFHRGGRNPYVARSREMKEKWRTMNDEEKQKFREEWKARCEHRRPI